MAMVASAAVAVLAAGKGTRMRSRIPKVLHRLCGTEMVRLVVDAAKGAQLDSIVVVVGPDTHTAVKESLGDDVEYALQKEPLGTGHALLQAQSSAQGFDNIVVLSADVPLIRPETIRDLLRLHLDTDASVTLLTATPDDLDGLGRIVRDKHGAVAEVVEEAIANDTTRAIGEVNTGVYCFRSSWLWLTLSALGPSANGEIFLTDLVSAASQQSEVVESLRTEQSWEALGVNTRAQLATAEAKLRGQLRERWMLAGVTMGDPSTVYLDLSVELDEDVVLHPNTHIRGTSRIAAGCQIGPNATIDHSTIGPRSRVESAVIEGSTLERDVSVGPFSHIRSGSLLESGVHVGSSAEIKASRLGPGTKCGHFSYIGNAMIGANVNIGAGTVTCNFDGTPTKKETVIGDDVLIGSATMLVAPVRVGDRSETGAGAVVTRDVPPDTLAYGVPARPRLRGGPVDPDTNVSVAGPADVAFARPPGE